MTKATILGETQGAEPEKKKIEFVRFLNSESKEVEYDPSDYDNIQLIALNYVHGLDFMVAWDAGANSCGCLYLGHFNDGVL